MLSTVRSAAVSAGLGRRAASTLALKYSNALFSAALAKSPAHLTKVQTELNAISSTIKNTPEFNDFISNPSVSREQRTTGIAELVRQAESAAARKEPVSDITKNLLTVLSENGRLAETEGVIEGFNALFAVYRGELTVTITSAAPLPRDVQAKLEATLKQSQTAQQAKSLKIATKINPSLLGGVIVDFGDKTIDLSVASRVTKLNNLIQQSV